MWLGVFTTVLLIHPQIVARSERWCAAEHFRSFVDCTNPGQVGYWGDDGKVRLLVNRKVGATYPLPPGGHPLFFDKKGSLHLALGKFASTSADGRLGSSTLEDGIIFAQGTVPIRCLRGTFMAQFAGQSPCVGLGGDEFSGIAVRGDQREITVISSPLNASYLTRYRRDPEGLWEKAQTLVSPGSPLFGMAALGPGNNDIRYISQNTVVFVGRWLGDRTPPREVPLLLPPTHDRKTLDRFLILVNVEDGLSMVLGRVSIPAVEAPGFSIGSIGMFAESKELFMSDGSYIWRISIMDRSA
jgi:hypothetical protein